MPIDEAINTLDGAIRSIREAVWLIIVSAEDDSGDELSSAFRSRMSVLLVDHLDGTIGTLEYTKGLLGSIDLIQSIQSPSTPPSIEDLDRSTNTYPPSTEN